MATYHRTILSCSVTVGVDDEAAPSPTLPFSSGNPMTISTNFCFSLANSNQRKLRPFPNSLAGTAFSNVTLRLAVGRHCVVCSSGRERLESHGGGGPYNEYPHRTNLEAARAARYMLRRSRSGRVRHWVYVLALIFMAFVRNTAGVISASVAVGHLSLQDGILIEGVNACIPCLTCMFCLILSLLKLHFCAILRPKKLSCEPTLCGVS
jgi:hypothetical protein